jgi:hypothetical protein
MSRISLALIILSAALVGCNLQAGSEAEITPPTEEAQVDTPPPGVVEVGTFTPETVVAIPGVPVTIEGTAYTAYQLPGDPFRFVCQDPCPLDLQFIYAEYAGFRAAHRMMVEMLGIDTLPELQPVDMHIDLTDSICSPAPYGHAYIYSSVRQAYTCTEGPGWYPTMEERIEKAPLVDEQYFPIHEYMHTLFFGRLSGTAGSFHDYKAEFFHDYIVPIPSFAIGIMDPATFCTFDTGLAPGDYGGALISELCQRNGFDLASLKLSLIELDDLYRTGGGQVIVAGYQQPSPSVAQYRDILNSLLGSDTTGAFAAACWPPELFGNSYTPLPACVVPVELGTATPLK